MRRRYIVGLLGFAVLCLIVYFFGDIVAYVLIAWVLSLLGAPMVDFMCNKLRYKKFRIGRSVAAVLTIIIMFGLFYALLRAFVPLILEQFGNLASLDFKNIGVTLEREFNITEKLQSIGVDLSERSAGDQIAEAAAKWFDPSKIGQYLGEAVGVAGNIVIGLFSVIFVLFFFLREQDLLINFIRSIIPNEYEEQAAVAMDRTANLLRRYFFGIGFQVTVITILVSLALSLFGVQNALLIGFFAALINTIPYLGPIIGASFAVFVTLSSHLDYDFMTEMLPLILKILGVFAVMQMLDNFILQPYIFSNSVMAHPMEIFIVILVGGRIGGIAGMILAIPAYTVFRVIASVFLSEFKIVQSLTNNLNQTE